jgi:uncharacterized protein (DUF302 family)
MPHLTKAFSGERFVVTTSRPFADVVADLERAVSHPNIPDTFQKMKAAATPDELRRVVEAAVAPAGLLEFIRFDFGMVLRKDDPPTNRSAVRFLLGNPLVMRELVRGAPDAGTHAPVSVLVDEREGQVHLSYDRTASLLGQNPDARAVAVARELDAQIERMLSSVAGEGAGGRG